MATCRRTFFSRGTIIMSQNGKGDNLRKGANLSAYWSNYDDIFRRPKKTIAEWAAHFGDHIKSYDGFREYSCADLLTEEEYNNGLVRCSIYYSSSFETVKKELANNQSVEDS